MHRRFQILIFSSVGGADTYLGVFSLTREREMGEQAIEVLPKAAEPNWKIRKR